MEISGSESVLGGLGFGEFRALGLGFRGLGFRVYGFRVLGWVEDFGFGGRGDIVHIQCVGLAATYRMRCPLNADAYATRVPGPRHRNRVT